MTAKSLQIIKSNRDDKREDLAGGTGQKLAHNHPSMDYIQIVQHPHAISDMQH